MVRIIAIGGGELRQRGTLALDEYIVEAVGTNHPRSLFLPTASEDSLGYWAAFRTLYGQELGCRTDVLFLVRERPRFAEIQAKIAAADLVYVGGGNTVRLLDVWRREGVDRLLCEAGERGTLLCGLSAGAMCWFRHGNSDAPQLEGGGGGQAKTVRVDCLGLVDASLCPHMDSEPYRWQEIESTMLDTDIVCVALDDHCAIDVDGDVYRIVAAREGRTAYRVYQEGGAARVEPMQSTLLSGSKLRPRLHAPPCSRLAELLNTSTAIGS